MREKHVKRRIVFWIFDLILDGNAMRPMPLNGKKTWCRDFLWIDFGMMFSLESVINCRTYSIVSSFLIMKIGSI